MNRKIGYYVHHHGNGHLSRALAIAGQAPARFVLIGTGLAGRTGDIEALDLPDDRTVNVPPADLPQALHYAPVDCDGVRRRVAMLTGWIAAARPALLVVDVSVEIAMLARLAATQVVYARLCGRRTDVAHLEAFRGARGLLAPFHEALDDPDTLDWVRKKTRYVPGLTAAVPATAASPGRVLLVLGTGGTDLSGAQIAAAAAATPALRWRVIGPAPAVTDGPTNLHCVGWVEDAAAEIAAAEIVIGAAGDGVVNEVLAAARPFICIPQARPFDEQISKALRLAATGAAIVLETWPDGPAWHGIITRARQLQPEVQRRLHDPAGAQHAATWLAEIAACA